MQKRMRDLRTYLRGIKCKKYGNVWNAYIHNLNKCCKKENTDAHRQLILLSVQDCRQISGAFEWSKTPQGFFYWSKIDLSYWKLISNN